MFFTDNCLVCKIFVLYKFLMVNISIITDKKKFRIWEFQLYETPQLAAYQ